MRLHTIGQEDDQRHYNSGGTAWQTGSRIRADAGVPQSWAHPGCASCGVRIVSRVVTTVVRTEGPRGRSLPGSARSHTDIGVHVGPCGVVTHPLDHPGLVLTTSSALPDLVEAMAHWDIAQPDQAQTVTLRITPGGAPRVLIHYRAPLATTWEFGDRGGGEADCRDFATVSWSGVVVMRPGGPLELLGVRLKPETAAHLLGEAMQCFLDARIGLDDLFGAGPGGPARGNARGGRGQRQAVHLCGRLPGREPALPPHRAARQPRRGPAAGKSPPAVSSLAAQLDLSCRAASRPRSGSARSTSPRRGGGEPGGPTSPIPPDSPIGPT